MLLISTEEHKSKLKREELYSLVKTYLHTHTHTHRQTDTHARFTALFPGPPGWAGARRELLDFMVQREINRGRHTDHLAGRHAIRTNECPPLPSTHIFLQAGCPSCHPTNSIQSLKAKTYLETTNTLFLIFQVSNSPKSFNSMTHPNCYVKFETDHYSIICSFQENKRNIQDLQGP